MKQKIDWIFFDIGGVIGDESAFQSIREQYNLKVIQMFQPDITMSDVLNKLPEASAMIGDLDENVISRFIRNDVELSKAIEQMRILRSKSPHYYNLLKIRPEVHDVLPILAKTYRLGLMANQGKEIRRRLKDSDAFDYLHYADVSADHSLSKPNPLFFQKILKQAGANPHHSVMVDDNIERGLIPAHKIGMKTVWFRLERRDIPKGIVDYTIDSLPELLNIF